MSAALLFSFVIGYFLILLVVAYYTSRNSNNDSFFIGNRSSNWMLVAFGMIGTSLSGVTFVSVPGAVGRAFSGGFEGFTYFQIVIGYVLGYFVVAFVLLPLYYKLNLTSIYNYLSKRLGFTSYKTGAAFFILSRTLGATARLYLVVAILQDAILASFGVPFWLTTFIILLMILLYTFEGGVKTIVWTDTLQTTCMLAGLVICIIYILKSLHLGVGEGIAALQKGGYTTLFVTDPNSKLFFLKQVLAGAFITIAMTGLDQEMMQKNISVKTLKDSQKNMLTFAFIQAGVVLLFLFLGGLLYLFAGTNTVAATGDKLFPTVALQHMPPVIAIVFIIALISALFPSADGAITALTSSFCIDLLGLKRRDDWDEQRKKKVRRTVHLTFAAIFLVVVLIFKWVNNQSMIGVILKVAAYTYGPLLGLFTFGIITRRHVADRLVPYVAVAAPVMCFFIDTFQKSLFGNFEIGLELLIINGALTFLGLLLISKPEAVLQKKPVMDLVNPLVQQYAERYTTPEDALLHEVFQYTITHHAHAGMISGHLQGKFLEAVSCMLRPQHILEIGTFTGYSALCLAKGLQPGGKLHTLELRPSDAATAQGFFNRSGYKEHIILHIGDALESIGQLEETWDLVFIDADKVSYIDYFNRVLPKVRENGFILADNVLFHGEVLEENVKGKNAVAIQAFNDFIAARTDVEKILLPLRDGVYLIRKL